VACLVVWEEEQEAHRFALCLEGLEGLEDLKWEA